MLKNRALHQKGDTIVEVLIAVVVVSVVLVGAYTISNASLRQIRMAQERGEAQKLAVGELEKITSCVPSSAPSIIGSTQYSVSITCPAANTVIVKVAWEGLNSRGPTDLEEVSMYYKAAP